jgi:hypothetical protein
VKHTKCLQWPHLLFCLKNRSSTAIIYHNGTPILFKGKLFSDINGKEQEITYTHALHTPTLNANLISVSTLNEAGLITTFGDRKGVAQKADGTIVLTSQKVNGMYLLETVDTSLNTPIAMVSLSQPTFLEQWHRCLTHCSPTYNPRYG